VTFQSPSSAPTPPPPAAEIVAGRYLVGRAIARGGMSIVYQSEHRYTGRTVALKLPDPELEQDSELRDRLLLEARALELSHHANVVQILDAGLDERNRAYVVMEMLDGRPLDGILTSRGKLPVADTVRIGVKMAEGLAAAHARGVMHRDIKPSNVFVVRDDAGRETVKIIDFGIAALRGASRGPTNRKLTQRDAVLGTPEYMAPEQLLMQENIDHRCDIYALAVSLYECLTGDVPFQGNYAEVLMRSTTQPPAPIHSVRKDVPAELAAVIARGMARDPAARWPTMIAFGRALLKSVDLADATTAPLLDSARGVVPLAEDDIEIVEAPKPPPLSVEQRRRFARASFTTPVRIMQSDGTIVDGRSEDISEGGLLVLTARACTPDERAMVRFVPPGGSSVVTLPVVLRWLKDGRGRSAAGLEFVDAPEGLRATIRAFVTAGGAPALAE
jgi:serine/threonine protein kinase